MSVFIWEGYRIYAGCIFILSGGSILMTIIETRKNNEQVRKMARYVCNVEILTMLGNNTEACLI
jgi:hypothetical protein